MTNRPDPPPDQHVVSPGQHLSRIAAERRFRGYPPLWNDPGNRALRRQRGNPHILAEGDVVSVPPLVAREVDRATEQRHRFRATIPALVLRVRLAPWPLGAAVPKPGRVLVDGEETAFTSPGQDTVEVPISPRADWCRVECAGRELALRIGRLQPADTVAGWRERLNNLGYRAGDADRADDYQLRSAVEEFQCDHGLVVDGKVGPATRARLVSVHGC